MRCRDVLVDYPTYHLCAAPAAPPGCQPTTQGTRTHDSRQVRPCWESPGLNAQEVTPSTSRHGVAGWQLPSGASSSKGLGHQANQIVRGWRELLLSPVQDFILLREQHDLVGGAEFVQEIENSHRPFNVGLHGNVVENDRRRLTCRREVLSKGEAKQEEQLLSGALGKDRRRAKLPAGLMGLQLQRRWVDVEVVISALGDTRYPWADCLIQHRRDVGVDLLLCSGQDVDRFVEVLGQAS